MNRSELEPSARSHRWPTISEARVRAVRTFGAIALVLIAYLMCAMFLPTLVNVGVGDDWVYVRAVETLVQHGELRILDLSVVTLVFQVFWGGLFALLFGPGFGVLRVSTIVITMLGGWACFAAARELDVSPNRSALAAAIYLFHPLSFALSYTFMTDPHFTAVMMLSLWATLRGRRPGATSTGWLIAGSLLSGAAFLIRQQGALIAPAVLLGLLLTGDVPRHRRGWLLIVQTQTLPLLTVALYYIWLLGFHGLPEQQGSFLTSIIIAGAGPTLLLTGRILTIETLYIGLFVLPLAAGAFVAVRFLPRDWSRLASVLTGAWAAIVVAGMLHFESQGFQPPPMARMPYLPQYLGTGGLQPADLLGDRPWLVSWRFLGWLTIACAAATLLWIAFLARRVGPPFRRDAHAKQAVIVCCVLLAQMVGVLPPSFHFMNWIVSVDRYLLPLLPLATLLGVWSLRGLPFRLPVAWVIVAFAALYSVAGVHDALVRQFSVWQMANIALEMGVPLVKLDAGAAWDGYYLYEYGRDRNIPTQTPAPFPWWTDLFGSATDSTYVVATSPIGGYDALSRIDYGAWLTDRTDSVYLLRRQGYPGPP